MEIFWNFWQCFVTFLTQKVNNVVLFFPRKFDISWFSSLCFTILFLIFFLLLTISLSLFYIFHSLTGFWTPHIILDLLLNKSRNVYTNSVLSKGLLFSLLSLNCGCMYRACRQQQGTKLFFRPLNHNRTRFFANVKILKTSSIAGSKKSFNNHNCTKPNLGYSFSLFFSPYPLLKILFIWGFTKGYGYIQ